MNENFIYSPGDIISVKNICFKDTNTIDTRINGHPMMVLNTVKDIGDRVYLLKMSGSYGSMDNLGNYYLLKATNSTGIRKASYVDLRFVYEITCNNVQPVAHIGEQEYQNLSQKLDERQSRDYMDEGYKNFKGIALFEK